MLIELRIRHYAVIDDLSLELGPGLNVLTGETGAGKSIIVGALSLLLGERATADVVRSGERRALVEGTFDVRGNPEIVARCEAAGIDLDEGWLILRREVQREGRNRAWINGSPATAGRIAELATGLVDLHGQHEHQALLRPAHQRAILDAYGRASAEVKEVAEAFETARELSSLLEAARVRIAEARERSDYLAFKATEIEAAAAEEDEDERLAGEARRLEHSEELLELSGSLSEAVYGEEGSLVERLGEIGRRMGDLTRIDPDTGELADLLDTARLTAEEMGRRLGDYHRSVEHDPGRLEEIRRRQDELYRLKSKYGATLPDVIEAGRAARAELERMEILEQELPALETELGEGRARLTAACIRLSARRLAAAQRLQREISAVLPELGMPAGRFEVELVPTEAPRAFGAEGAEFRVSLNAGFEAGPLARVASGGELSRVMLALKTALAGVDQVPTLVFDEIDAGIGGQVAHQVAARLAAVSAGRQVFAVTHLPQIAAVADVHLHVVKDDADGRAAARVRRLQGDERVAEMARMLGGDPNSAASRRHAEELLASGAPTSDRAAAS